MRHLMADVEFRCHVCCHNVSFAVVVFVVLLCLCLVLEDVVKVMCVLLAVAEGHRRVVHKLRKSLQDKLPSVCLVLESCSRSRLYESRHCKVPY